MDKTRTVGQKWLAKEIVLCTYIYLFIIYYLSRFIDRFRFISFTSI